MSQRYILHLSAAIVALTVSIPAFAHSHPITMNPAPDSTVASPTEVSILFSEDLVPTFSSLRLMDAKGTVVSKDASRLDPANCRHMTLVLPRLAPGVYTLAWATATADGHRLSRSYAFTVK